MTNENTRRAYSRILDRSLTWYTDMGSVELSRTVLRKYRAWLEGHLSASSSVNQEMSALRRQARWQEYAIRFFFAGVITAVAGIVATQFGPALGGLFLAFPASATQIENHESKRKEEHGVRSQVRGADAASIDAARVLGNIGLVSFALLVWRLIEG